MKLGEKMSEVVNGIRLKEVYIKNFRGYGENENEEDKYFKFTDLDKDFILLNGYNGYGKTSFFEAIEWCLTDSVERLKKFKNYYNGKILKKSFYLKFYSSDEDKHIRNKREISVKLIFNNDLIIVRKTKCNKLKLTPNDSYISEVEVYKNGVRVEENNVLNLNDFINNNEGKEYIHGLLNTNFLGQENINDFIRATNTIERKKTLLRLLNLEDISIIKEKSERIKKSKAIRNTIAQNNELIEKINGYKIKIDERFFNNNWGTIEQYIDTLNKEKEKYCDFIKNNSEFYSTNKDVIGECNEFTIDNCINKIQKFKLLSKNIMKKIENAKVEITELKNVNDKIEKINLCNKFIKKDKLITSIEFASNINIDEINESYSKYNTKYIYNDKEIKKLNNEKELLYDKYLYNKLVSNYFKNKFRVYIDFRDMRIKEDFWNSYKVFWSDLKIDIIQNCEKDKISEDIVNSIEKEINEDIYENRYKNLNEKLTILNHNIEIANLRYNELTNNNNSYNKLLKDVKNYILNNKLLDECPICYNNDFSNEKYKSKFKNYIPKETNLESLMNIIDLTISEGDNNCKILLENLNKLSIQKNDLIEKINNEIIKAIEGKFTDLYYKVHNIFETIYSSKQEKIDLLFQENSRLIRQLKEMKTNKDRYNECIKNITEKISEVKVESLNNKVLMQMILELKLVQEKVISEMIAKEIFLYEPSKDEVVEKRDIYINQLDKIYITYIAEPQNLKRDIRLKEIVVKIFSEQLDILNKINFYELPDEYEEILSSISKNKYKIDEIQAETLILKKYLSNAEKILNNVTKEEVKIFNELSKENTLISWIYNQINPHPYYRDIIIDLDDNGGIIFKGSTEEVIYDQIFSAAQLNILALSIFLGLGIPSNYTELEQLYLDDPIQSMDDTNVLALIDVFRAIIDSKSSRSLMVSSHDNDFSKLISIKMRNRDITHYDFVGYGKEGPIIKQIK